MMHMSDYRDRPWRKANEPRYGGQSYGGSPNVGSRLAGDSVGSRLAGVEPQPVVSATHFNANPQFYSRSSPSVSNSGFGSSTSPNVTPNRKMTLQEVQQAAAVKADIVKSWGVKTYKCTKQILSERLGRGSRTVDLELEAKIEILRDTKIKYENLVQLTKALANHFSSIIQTQKVLASTFSELSSKSQELQEELRYNGESQMVIAKNGESLLAAINFFTGNVTTLCGKTMEDSLLTVSKYESARLSYDAYRNELEAMNAQPRTESNIMKQAQAQANFNTQRTNYERLRDDVGVKLQFLDENRVKVMQKNLLLFHNAIAAYFAGNQQQLEGTLKQFSIKVSNSDSSKPSWLERN